MIALSSESSLTHIIRLCAFIPLFALYCTTNDPLGIPYEPRVVFVGSVSGDYDSLPGNRDWPNTCILKGDTVKMTFFSESFKEVNNMRSGDFIRMDLFPCSTCVSGINTKHVRFHMARYLSSNFSYEITPSDTVGATDEISIQIRTLDRHHNGAVDLYGIGATANPLVGTTDLDLINGRISGSIE
jgi:hypothetical protein